MSKTNDWEVGPTGESCLAIYPRGLNGRVISDAICVIFQGVGTGDDDLANANLFAAAPAMYAALLAVTEYDCIPELVPPQVFDLVTAALDKAEGKVP